jgi:hypothetical protein
MLHIKCALERRREEEEEKEEERDKCFLIYDDFDWNYVICWGTIITMSFS